MSKKAQTSRLIKLVVALEKYAENHENPEGVSPEALTPRLRRKVVELYLRERSEATNRMIAEIAGVSEWTVSRYKRRLVEQLGWEVDELDVRRVATETKIKATELFTKAVRAKEFATAWRIHKEYVEVMQSLGYVKRAPLQVVTGHFDLRQMARDYFRDAGAESLNPAEFFDRLRQAAGGNGGNDKQPAVLVAAPTARPGGEGGGDSGDAGARS